MTMSEKNRKQTPLPYPIAPFPEHWFDAVLFRRIAIYLLARLNEAENKTLRFSDFYYRGQELLDLFGIEGFWSFDTVIGLLETAEIVRTDSMMGISRGRPYFDYTIEFIGKGKMKLEDALHIDPMSWCDQKGVQEVLEKITPRGKVFIGTCQRQD
jgi:hypothetical protein